jgi:UTP--glucose-1-phosphate uridylyltransferase
MALSRLRVRRAVLASVARFRAALHLNDPPWRLALSLAVGVFISFTPFYGLQTLLAVGLAMVLRLNRAATVAGTWLNLPWFAPLVYAGALRVGTLVVPDREGIRGAWLAQLLSQPGSVSWRDLPVLLDHVSLPLLVGTSVLGGAAGILTYVVSFHLISRRRTARERSPEARCPGYDVGPGAGGSPRGKEPTRMTVRKAVFPAAGLGTRFLPATKAQPKEMLPIVDKPTIQYVVEEAVASGLSEIILVTGRNKRAIEDHFDAAFELEYYLADRGKVEELAQIKAISELASVSYVRQKEPLGLGHAILCARPLVGDEPFGVFLGDDIIGFADVPCMRQLLDVFHKYGGPVIAVERVPRERIHQYGVIAGRHVDANVYEITDLVEKPRAHEAPSDLAIIGRYVLTPDIFAILSETMADARGEVQLTDGLRALRARRPMFAVQFEGRRYDTGDKLGFLKATVEFALARPDLADAFRNYLASLKV